MALWLVTGKGVVVSGEESAGKGRGGGAEGLWSDDGLLSDFTGGCCFRSEGVLPAAGRLGSSSVSSVLTGVLTGELAGGVCARANVAASIKEAAGAAMNNEKRVLKKAYIGFLSGIIQPICRGRGIFLRAYAKPYKG